MKNIIVVLLAVIIGSGLASCQKDHTNPDPGSLIATIDGSQFIANKTAVAEISSDVIAIIGQSVDGGQIVLRVKDSGVHVYTFDINSPTNVGAYSINDEYAYATNQGNTNAESGGTLSITSIDEANKRITGTFSMKVYRQLDSKQIAITEGSFTNISYDTEGLPAANTKDTFNVKADGAKFPGYSITGIAAFGKINISVSNKDVSKTIGLSFPANVIPGTYNFSSFGDYIAQYNIGSSYLMGDSGSVTILEHNTTTKRIKGSFNFHASELIGSKTSQLTEGYFSVGYQ